MHSFSKGSYSMLYILENGLKASVIIIPVDVPIHIFVIQCILLTDLHT